MFPLLVLIIFIRHSNCLQSKWTSVSFSQTSDVSLIVHTGHINGLLKMLFFILYYNTIYYDECKAVINISKIAYCITPCYTMTVIWCFHFLVSNLCQVILITWDTLWTRFLLSIPGIMPYNFNSKEVMVEHFEHWTQWFKYVVSEKVTGRTVKERSM